MIVTPLLGGVAAVAIAGFAAVSFWLFRDKNTNKINDTNSFIDSSTMGRIVSDHPPGSSTGKDLNIDSDEFYKVVTDRFTEIAQEEQAVATTSSTNGKRQRRQTVYNLVAVVGTENHWDRRQTETINLSVVTPVLEKSPLVKDAITKLRNAGYATIEVKPMGTTIGN